MQIKMDRAAVREIEQTLSHIRNGSNRAMANAINHTLTVTRTEASKEIRGQVKLKAAYVKERLRLRRASVANPTGRIATPTRGILLSRFTNREYKSGGIGVQVKPGSGQRKRMPGAFYLTFANGVRAIAIRTKRGPGLGRSEGIKVLYGPSVSQVFTDVKDDLQAPSAERLIARMGHEAERLLARQ
ncbi:MAG: phage tail protein [Pseudomonadota bacterium]